ncbi:hypothetical protein [Vibrio panuliri]|uniref:Lipoprotein n=1 Tax=Vibrio panuliri TaxID=1381081 RepID=A0ABX3FM38_9VIBR|nr:hypothetical protein [Vibrio panuliri]KAB1458080.1 hypothetical protein F7O85_10235 [Vibrio panuliri]OLQ95123.1 hypothetical protein BIY20_07190 [Vibrio panuliri]
MKKLVTALALVAALSGCEDATKAIDQAQEAANSAVDSLQEKMESFDTSKLNLEQFGDATDSAKEFAESVEDAMHADFANPEALNKVQDKIANTYNCLIDATSESTAEKLLDKVLSAIGSQETQSVIEKGIEKAKAAQECVM